MAASTSSGQAAQELRERAKKMRESARYAQGQTYHEEMAEAQQLDNQANRLEDEAARKAEDHA